MDAAWHNLKQWCDEIEQKKINIKNSHGTLASVQAANAACQLQQQRLSIVRAKFLVLKGTGGLKPESQQTIEAKINQAAIFITMSNLIISHMAKMREDMAAKGEVPGPCPRDDESN